MHSGGSSAVLYRRIRSGDVAIEVTIVDNET